MTIARSRRALLALAVLSSGALSTRAARADDVPASKIDCAAPGSVSVHVEAHRDGAMAPRVEREIASELATTPATPCWRLGGDFEAPEIHIEVRWPDAQRARVVIVATTPGRVHYGIRDLDIQKLPADGVPLAIAIATDELLETIGEQVAHARVPPLPAPRVARPAPEEPRPSPVTTRERPVAFGPAAALDIVGSGLALAGPDAQMIVPLTKSFALGLHVGVRASTESRRGLASRAAAAWVAGANLRVGSQRRSSAFSASVGMDAITVKITARDDAALEALALARVGLGAHTTIAKNLRLTADAYAGAVLNPVHARVGDGPARSFGDGLALGGALGIVALF